MTLPPSSLAEQLGIAQAALRNVRTLVACARVVTDPAAVERELKAIASYIASVEKRIDEAVEARWTP